MAGKTKRKVFYTVNCRIHGKESFVNHEHEVRVLPPKSKKVAVSGCPSCKSEKAKK